MSYSVTIDLHEVCVIFGYHSGTALKDFVMRYKNKKIAKKVLGLNQGSAVFVLKDG